VAARALAEGPQVRQDVPRDATPLVGDADYNVLRGFADRDFDGGRGWWGGRALLLLLDDGLDGVPQELADDIFEVVEDVWEGGVEVALEFDFGENGGGSISGGGEGLDLLPAAGDDFFSVAFEEYLADKLGLGRFGVGEMPRRFEGFG
jgi:hypothetical protein